MFTVPMLEDLPDHPLSGEERDGAHLSAAARADQGAVMAQAEGACHLGHGKLTDAAERAEGPPAC